MVRTYLTDHPGEAFTAGQLSKALDRSSGAIANALERLADSGALTRLDGRPKRYETITPVSERPNGSGGKASRSRRR